MTAFSVKLQGFIQKLEPLWKAQQTAPKEKNAQKLSFEWSVTLLN